MIMNIVTVGFCTIGIWWSCHVYYMFYIALTTDDIV